MGCGASAASKYDAATGSEEQDAPPELYREPSTKSTYSAPAAVRFEGDLDGCVAHAYTGTDQTTAMEMRYPMHCMKMSDFLALKNLDAHNGLVERGLVVPLDLDGMHQGVQIQFVSHQWLGFTVADPKGEHLATMQSAFKCAIAEGDGLFKSVDDWKAFANGITSDNLKSLRATKDEVELDDSTAAEAEKVAASEEMDEAALALRRDAFKQSVADSWVWMDYISVPQTVGLTNAAAVTETIGKQADAIRSIPSYIRKATCFWICTPQGAKHESGQLCSYATWNERGWCRLEETTIALLNLRQLARPIMLTDPVGSRPNAVTPDGVDRVSVHIQRRNAVLTGAFSCCRMNHQVKTLDGGTSCIPCDKVILREVLGAVYEDGLAKARDGWKEDGEHDTRDFGTGTFWSSMVAGFIGVTDFSFVRWYFNKSLRQAIFAESKDEPDFVALGWSKPFEQLGPDDARLYCARWGMEWKEDHSVEKAAGAFWPAQEGNLPMLRYFVEKLEIDPMPPNPLGVTALHCAVRQGFNSIVKYLVAKATERVGDGDELKAWLDLKTLGVLKLAPIDGAAVRGHPSTIKLLASLGADIHVRRSNGRTPLHSAAAFGHAACVKELLALGADPEAKADDGSKPVDLVTKSCSLWAWPTTQHDEVVELLNAATSKGKGKGKAK